jgi:hypothetical protein
VDQDAGALFVIGFFYHALSRDRDAELDCTDSDAVERARNFDPYARPGTHLFRHYAGSIGGL